MYVRALSCVRCGQRPRHRTDIGEVAFICSVCRENPTAQTEWLLAERMGVSTGRAWLVRDKGWRGGWHDRVRVSA